jgi:sulfofructose kinase
MLLMILVPRIPARNRLLRLPALLQIAAVRIEFVAMPRPLPLVDLVGIGLNSLDTLIQIPRSPAPGSKLQIASSQPLPGGQTASVAVACQHWGLRTRYVGKIGDDTAGRFLRKELAREGVEAHLIQVPSCQSQLAYLLVDQLSGERTILWQRDPRLDIQPAELRPSWVTRARLLHLDGHPSAPAAAAARWAQESGIPVTADLDNIYPGVEELLENVDFLIGSREFPSRLTGIADPLESLPAIARQFGCKVTGATLGSEGVLTWDGESFLYSSAFRVQAVDTTGAGDIFHAGFAYALLQGWPLARALDFAGAAAALNCTALGARGGIRPLPEIERLLHEGQRHPPAFDAARLVRCSAGSAAKPSSSDN